MPVNPADEHCSRSLAVAFAEQKQTEKEYEYDDKDEYDDDDDDAKTCAIPLKRPFLKMNSQSNQNIESPLTQPPEIKSDHFPIELDLEENLAATSALPRSQSQDNPPLPPSNPVASVSQNLPPRSSIIPHFLHAVSPSPLHPHFLHALNSSLLLPLPIPRVPLLLQIKRNVLGLQQHQSLKDLNSISKKPINISKLPPLISTIEVRSIEKPQNLPLYLVLLLVLLQKQHPALQLQHSLTPIAIP